MKKAVRIFAAVGRGLLLAAAALMLLLTVVQATAGRPQAPGLFGCRAFTVLSDSMRPIFDAGDLVLTRSVDVTALREGDIIAFRSSDPSFSGKMVTHRILSSTQFRGELAFLTAGDNSSAADFAPALASDVLGQYCASIPKLGFLFSFLQTPAGFLSLIFGPLFLLMLFETGRMLYGLRRDRIELHHTLAQEWERLRAQTIKLQEETAQITEERAALETARQECSQLAANLGELKEELEQALHCAGEEISG